MNIAYVTGSRADFGRMTFILRGLQKEHKLSIIATAQHLQEKAGMTIKEIEKEFPVASTVDMTPPDDTTAGMAHALSAGISDMTTKLKKINPDIVIVLGDRSEMLAGALAGYFLNIPVWHIGGGFTTGSADDRIRHAITIFSNYHLVANETCLKKVISLGADKKKTFIVGAPDLEAIRQKEYAAKAALMKKYHPGKRLVLVSFHPDTDAKDNAQQMRTLLDALKEIDAQYIITTPNRDAGGDAMEKVLEKHDLPHTQIFKNIPYKDYLGLMANASAIIGNSSAGIIEAPSFGLPSVNIGNRQQTRERAANVIDVPADKKAITKALDTALNDQAFIKRSKDAKNPYGDGNTSKKAIDLINLHGGRR